MKGIKYAQKLKIYRSIYEDQCLLYHDDVNMIHEELGLPNLIVRHVAESLRGKGYLNKTHTWRTSYYSLTPSGEEALRDILGIVSENKIENVDNVEGEMVEEKA